MLKSEVRAGKWYYYQYGSSAYLGKCLAAGSTEVVFEPLGWSDALMLREYYLVIAEGEAPSPSKPHWFSRLWGRIWS